MKRHGIKSIGFCSKRYTLMIIPERYGTSKSFSLTRTLLLSPLLVIAIVFLLLIFTLFKYSSIIKAYGENMDCVRSLQSAIEVQNNNLKEYEALEQELKSKITEIEELEKILKQKTGQVTESSESSTNDLNKSELIAFADESIVNAGLVIEASDNYMKKIEMARLAAARIPSEFPCLGVVTSTFGRRRSPTSRSIMEFHNGIDIASSYGTKIKAVADGTVVNSCYNGSYGYVVVINHGNGYSTLYGHNSRLCVKKGQAVKKGDVIALMGSTGRSTGVHVHFEALYNNVPINPYSIIKGGN